MSSCARIMYLEIESQTYTCTYSRVIAVVLERLVIVERRLYRDMLVQEESIAYLHLWNEVIIVVGMLVLCVHTEIQSVLDDVVSCTDTQGKDSIV